MDDAKRRAMIKSLAVEQKKTGEIVVPSVPGSSGKRKQPPKSDRPHKQPKVSMEPIVGLMAEGPKAVNQVKQGAGKGLMHAPPVSEEKPPPLLRDDSKFALEKLTSILSAEDYEDLGNHSTEAMGETGLFAVGQTEEELSQLHKWKFTMEQKFELSENTRKELEQKTEEAGKVLKSRADEVKDLKKKLRHAKDDAVSEYRNSESLLKELGGSFLQGFDDALRQIKKTYPDLDVSMITLTDQDQTSALPVASENTEDLFGEEAAQGDGESAPPNEVAVADPKKAELNGQRVVPVFYKVDPSEVRKQEKCAFKEALAEQENKFKNNKEKVQRWRTALKEAADLSGWHYKDGSSEFKFIQQIIEEILYTKLNGIQLFVAKYPVGVNSRAKEIESLLNIKVDGFRMVGIHGLGGIGKTTIAKAVYNRIFKHFDGSCFLENVRESSETNNDMIQLQEKLLFNILRGKDLKVLSVAHGTNMIVEMLLRKRILVILDDVDKTKQIENLFGNYDWFASGSRVLITTRDKHLLDNLGKVCTTYKMTELDNCEALELFNQHAFQGNELEEDYSILANQVIQYANGLPLALTIIGSDLCGKPRSQWESAVQQYGKIPKEDIHNILEVSYAGLEATEKDIFLDIACFFKGRNKYDVVNILHACDLYPGNGIPNLVNKCLVTIGHDGILGMHDLVQQMGREIVRQESPKILETRSRLWYYDDACEVLTGSKGSDKIRGIMWHSPNRITVKLHDEAFKKMENLKFLMVRNVIISEELIYLPNGLKLLEWHEYPFPLPSNYRPQQLVVLEMPRSCSRLGKLFMKGGQYNNLKSINLERCISIRKLPDLCTPNLERLNINGCENLIEVYEAIGSLDKLKSWSLKKCKKLQILPSCFRLKSLEDINLDGCVSLEKLPDLGAPNLENLNMDNCENLIEVHEAIGSLDKLKRWDLSNCKKLQILPSSFRLKSLKDIYLNGCVSLEKLPDLGAPNLEYLNINNCENLIEVHEAIGSLDKLKLWDLMKCKKLQILPSSFRLNSLEEIDLDGCVSLEKLPDLAIAKNFKFFLAASG
ncbi:protein SUPPRESSOR OF npr1-1, CONSTITUTIVE 1-like [Quercus lobata]|uniref:protein SUPPRESSOR OF npr1-1, CONSTITUTIVE 1-like n=1 Tax=Quercus lobata TaxID=97700 RepID=UPI001243E84C|nr:protein SUPPRESSOR OF npr1-1, CONSTITUTIVE 1-like [Quercus lobata]